MREITLGEFERMTKSFPRMPYSTSIQAEAVRAMEIGQALVLEHDGFGCFGASRPGHRRPLCTLISLIKSFQYIGERCKRFRCRHIKGGQLAVLRLPDREVA